MGESGQKNFYEIIIVYLNRDNIKFLLYVIKSRVKRMSNTTEWSYIELDKACGWLGELLVD